MSDKQEPEPVVQPDEAELPEPDFPLGESQIAQRGGLPWTEKRG